MLRDDTFRCIAYGCPSCVDERLAEEMKGYVMNVVLHDDIIPRITPQVLDLHHTNTITAIATTTTSTTTTTTNTATSQTLPQLHPWSHLPHLYMTPLDPIPQPLSPLDPIPKQHHPTPTTHPLTTTLSPNHHPIP